MRGLSLGSLSRKRFSKVLRETGETIMPQEVSKILGMTRQSSSLLLSYWNKQFQPVNTKSFIDSFYICKRINC